MIKIFKFSVLYIVLINGLIEWAYAQPIEVIADYPLILDLADSTGNNTDVVLEGNPTPPTSPSNGVELCQNGIYVLNSNGHNIQTPDLNNFDLSNFEIEVDFKVTATPNNAFNYSGIIMGGKFSRFIGIIVDDQNRIGLKFNNTSTNVIFSGSIINLNTFYTGRLRYDNGVTELFLDDVSILSQSLPPLVAWMDSHDFTTTDFSTGQPFEGCIRNLVFSSSVQNVFIDGFE